MSDIIKLSDKISPKDVLTFEQKKGFRTKVIAYNELGEKLFETQNTIVIGGSLYVLEKLFGVRSSLNVDYLNNIMGIATSGPPITDIYPKDNVVCLFGVGIGGAGDSITSVKPVDFKEREIMSMIPFRYTDQPLLAAERHKYWFRKTNKDGKVAYYLKRFETEPVIKALWKDSEGGEDGTEVQGDVHTSTRTEPIETFVELVLKISKNDCREWFEVNGNIEQARINSIGLFTGVLGTLADGTQDYKQVKLFSKLNITNEMLTLAKDLTIIYRIYTS